MESDFVNYVLVLFVGDFPQWVLCSTKTEDSTTEPDVGDTTEEPSSTVKPSYVDLSKKCKFGAPCKEVVGEGEGKYVVEKIGDNSKFVRIRSPPGPDNNVDVAETDNSCAHTFGFFQAINFVILLDFLRVQKMETGFG